MSDSYRRQVELSKPIQRALESARASNFSTQGMSMRVASTVEHWMDTTEGKIWLTAKGYFKMTTSQQENAMDDAMPKDGTYKTPRQQFQHVFSRELVEYAAEVAKYESDDFETLDRIARADLRREAADAVIAHLWDASDDPEVMEAMARELHYNDWDPRAGKDWDADMYQRERGRYIEQAKAATVALLTALLGPRPNGGDDE